MAKRLREQLIRPRPLILAISGYGQPADKRRSAEAGVDLHWVKPVEPAALQALLVRFHMLLSGPAGGTGNFAATTSEADGGTLSPWTG